MADLDDIKPEDVPFHETEDEPQGVPVAEPDAEAETDVDTSTTEDGEENTPNPAVPNI